MDFKMFGIVVLILGVFILSVGVDRLVINQPKELNLLESKVNALGEPDHIENLMNVKITNFVRADKRNEAKKVLFAGGIVVFLGLGICLSAKKKRD